MLCLCQEQGIINSKYPSNSYQLIFLFFMGEQFCTILRFTYDIPVYDSLFLAQAQHYGTSLVTSDKKQGKIAVNYQFRLKWFK